MGLNWVSRIFVALILSNQLPYENETLEQNKTANRDRINPFLHISVYLHAVLWILKSVQDYFEINLPD